MRNDKSAVLVRIGISLVFLWFGIEQLLHPQMWLALVPNYAVNLSHLSANTLVLTNGVAEVILGLLLILGIWTKLVSGLLSLHAIHIFTIVGYNAVGVRDFAVAISTISIFLNGADNWSLDRYFKEKKLA